MPNTGPLRLLLAAPPAAVPYSMPPTRDTISSALEPASPAPSSGAFPPHPLSQVRHEFIWEGKYDEQGRRCRPDAPAFPFRTVEVWGNEPVKGDGEASFRLWSEDRQSTAWPNLLIRGDNRLALGALAAQFRGEIDLIYIDPPYDCGVDYRVDVRIGDSNASVHAYRDAWGDGHESYEHMMAERLMLMRDLLCPEGCIFVHCDWRASAVLRLILDDIFGRGCFRNEIVWRRAPNLGRQAASSQLGRVVDSIFVYSAREGTPFRGQTPTRRTPVELDGSGKPRGSKWDEVAQLFFTTAPRGDYTDDSIARLRAEGRVWESPSGKIYIKYFLRRGDDGRWYKDQPVDTLWDDADVRPLRHCSKDELGIGYATQKPEGLLGRIISWACPPGGLVADFFCGSGTTGVVAQRLGRRWLLADLGRQAIHTTRKRLATCATGLSSGRCGFALLDLAPHDRLHWFARTFQSDLQAYRSAIVRRFAGEDVEPTGKGWIHALRGDAIIHVAEVDRIVDADFAGVLAQAARIAGASRVLCLGFEFSVDIRRDLGVIAGATGVEVHPIVIPPEIVESNCRELPAWFEVARLEAQLISASPGCAAVRLSDYQPITAGVSTTDARRLGHDHAGLELVDAWSIEADWRSDQPLRPTWHTQRSPRRRPIPLESDPLPIADSARWVLVRVIDVFGHETRTVLALPTSE